MSATPSLTPAQRQALDALAANHRALDEAGVHLRASARACRDAGVSYAQIGATLGTSRQAAWERFARATTPAATDVA